MTTFSLPASLPAGAEALLYPPHQDSESLFLAEIEGRWWGVYRLYGGEPARALALLHQDYRRPERLFLQGNAVFLLPWQQDQLDPISLAPSAEEVHSGLADFHEARALWYAFYCIRYCYRFAQDRWVLCT